jgi:hypothetical protein
MDSISELVNMHSNDGGESLNSPSRLSYFSARRVVSCAALLRVPCKPRLLGKRWRLCDKPSTNIMMRARDRFRLRLIKPTGRLSDV